MILIIDNYDSFTYNLFDYILQLGYACTVIRNDEYTIDQIVDMEFDAVVISPGPGKPQDAGVCKELIDRLHDQKPILGICLGYQAIGEYFKAQLQVSRIPMHGKTSHINFPNDTILFRDLISPIQVMRYHSLVLENINLPLRLTASTNDGELMAFEHVSLPLAGVQFHPESILTPNGLKILKNWLESL